MLPFQVFLTFGMQKRKIGFPVKVKIV